MIPRLLTALCLAAAPVAAQTGPFQDGELLIYNPGVNTPQLIRVDPSTGDAAVLLDGFFWGGWADSMTYDSHRGGVVASLSLPPDPYWKERLWVLSHDGGAVAIPGVEDEQFTGLEAIGDGRIYFQRGGFGNTTIEYFDASNALHVLMDETGLAPAAVEVEHMVYDPGGNALIASANPSWSQGGCGDPTMNTIYRIPLSPDGSRLGGPVTCISLLPSTLIPMGLSRRPDGNIQVTFAGTAMFGFVYLEKFWIVDPDTLAAAPYAESDLADIDGGVYSTRLNRLVILYDTTNELRTYLPGEGDNGTALPVSLPIGDGTTGYSPADKLTQLDVSGPSCAGYVVNHGAGLAGSGGLVPTLGGVGCPDIGQTWSLVAGQALGGAFGVLFVGTGITSLPFKGGTYYVDGLVFDLSFVASGTPGMAGEGQLNVPVLTNDPNLIGFEITAQAGFQDAGAPFGASLTPAVRIKGW